MKDTMVVMWTYNRFELARVTALCVLAFAPKSPFVVSDDCSDDPRLDAWFGSLAKRGLLKYHRQPKNGGAGRQYQWAAANLAPHAPRYLMFIDSDLFLAPDALQTLRKAYQHWRNRSTTAGFLTAIPIESLLPEVTGEEYQLWYGNGDSPLFIIPSKLYNRLGKYIERGRSRHLGTFTKKMNREGRRRAYCVSPRVNLCHLGTIETTIHHSGKGTGPSYWGGRGSCSLPCGFDLDRFIRDYPHSAVDIGNRLRDEFLWGGDFYAAKEADGLVI